MSLRSILEFDARLSNRLRVAEQPGLLRTISIFFAHSGNSWFWGLALILIWVCTGDPLLEEVGGRSVRGHIGAGCDRYVTQVHDPPPQARRRMGRHLPQHRSALVPVRACRARVPDRRDGDRAGSLPGQGPSCGSGRRWSRWHGWPWVSILPQTSWRACLWASSSALLACKSIPRSWPG